MYKDEMDFKLIYINKIGFNFRGEATYEFIFCDETLTTLDTVWGDGWENLPAVGYAQPPDEPCISKVGIIKCKDYELDVAHDSQYFSMSDAKDNIIALGYELIDEDFIQYPRLVFHFGEDLDSVEQKLKLRKLKLTYEDL